MNHVSISRKKLPIPICLMILAMRLSAFSHTGNITRRTRPTKLSPMNLSRIHSVFIFPVRNPAPRTRRYIMNRLDDMSAWYIWPLENFDRRSIVRF